MPFVFEMGVMQHVYPNFNFNHWTIILSCFKITFIFSLFAFITSLAREIIKDMEDLKGDNTFGCKTLPIILGIRKTKAVVYFLLALFSSLVITLNAIYTQMPFYYFLIFLFAPLGIFLFVLVRADTKRDFYMLSQWCKVIMVLGIISMAFVN